MLASQSHLHPMPPCSKILLKKVKTVQEGDQTKTLKRKPKQREKGSKETYENL